MLYLLQKHICHGALQQARELLVSVPIKHAIYRSDPLCKVVHSQRRYTQPITDIKGRQTSKKVTGEGSSLGSLLLKSEYWLKVERTHKKVLEN